MRPPYAASAGGFRGQPPEKSAGDSRTQLDATRDTGKKQHAEIKFP